MHDSVTNFDTVAEDLVPVTDAVRRARVESRRARDTSAVRVSVTSQQHDPRRNVREVVAVPVDELEAFVAAVVSDPAVLRFTVGAPAVNAFDVNG